MIFINMMYTYATIVYIVIWLLLIARIETIDYKHLLQVTITFKTGERLIHVTV